jgi:DNA-binding beta-propeller fold protein YncE
VDTDNNRILVLNQDGSQVTTLGGSGVDVTSDPAVLRQPWGVAIGLDGNVYVADTWNHRVAVFSKDGDLLRSWGHEGLPSQGDVTVDAFWGPRDIAVGLDGNVYVADTGNKRVRVYTPEGDFVRDIGLAGTGFGQLDEPVGLAFNPVSGELFVADVWNKRIQVFNTSGVPVREWPVNMWFSNRQSYNRPYLAVSPDGTLVYTVDMDDRHRVVAYNLNGVPQFSFNQPDDLEANNLGLRSPAGLAFDASGRLYVVDASQNKVFVFPPSDVRGDVQPIPQLEMEPDAIDATAEAPEG